MDRSPGETATEPCAPRSHFHLALAGILVPVLGLPVTLFLALADRQKRDATEEDRTWTRRLSALAAVDVMVVLSLALLYRLGEPAKALSGPGLETKSPLRIGVLFDSEGSRPRIKEVLPDSPAWRSGLQAGDVIRSVDGAEMKTPEEVGKAIAGGTPGSRRRLEILRGEASLTVDVVPEARKAVRDWGLMEITKSDPRLPWLVGLMWVTPIILVGGLAKMVARRRKAPRVVVWRALFLVLVGAVGMSVGVLFAAQAAMGGWSVFGALLALFGQTFVMLILTVLFRAKLSPVSPEPALRSPVLSPFRATWLGIFYLVAGYIRLAIVIHAFNTFVLKSEPPPSALQLIAQTRLGILGVLMLGLDVVLIGPITEELLFRGLLLPRVAAQLGPRWALWASAILFASLHYYYGTFTLMILFYGLVLGWARLRTGGLGAPIGLHVLINAVSMVALLWRS